MRGTLRKRVGPRGTSWQLIVRVVDPTAGQRRQLSRTVRLATRREAERELRAFVSEVEGGAERADRRTVAELLDAWHAHQAGRGRSITTLREYLAPACTPMPARPQLLLQSIDDPAPRVDELLRIASGREAALSDHRLVPVVPVADAELQPPLIGRAAGSTFSSVPGRHSEDASCRAWSFSQVRGASRSRSSLASSTMSRSIVRVVIPLIREPDEELADHPQPRCASRSGSRSTLLPQSRAGLP
jgi:hypothetical protein